MLPRPKPPQPSSPRQLLVFQHPIFWGTASVLVLSGLFLMEFWQPRFPRGIANQPTPNLNRAEPTQPNNPLRYQGSPSAAGSFSDGGLPVPPALPGASTVPIPNLPTATDPALLPLPERSPQEQTSPSSTARRPSSFSPGVNRRPDRDRSTDLYNPTGIPMPESWQRRSMSRPQTAIGASVVEPAEPSPESAEGSPVSPLQSALDRVDAANSPVLPQVPGLPQSPGQAGIAPPVPTQPTVPYPQSTPSTAGYTTPPAFRTPENTSPFYSSPSSSPASPSSSSPAFNPAQPGMVDNSLTTPSTPMASPSGYPQSNSGQTLGGRDINTFANP